MNVFRFSNAAQKKFLALDTTLQKRIRAKLQECKNSELATHRLRIGDYRLIVKKENEQEFLVLDVGHRSTIYK